NYDNDSTLTNTLGNIDYENSQILYLKVYDDGGYMMAFGNEGDSIQLPEKIVADDDTFGMAMEWREFQYDLRP
ncbi:MAG: hypothetical protein IJ150_03970, partial [Bacteroidales bacterium]|nr:hypothetical protein [Bacteroidales bacterium]